MTAREKFTVNQTVIATPRFYEKHRRYRDLGVVTGIVRGFGVSGQSVRVQIPPASAVYRYPMGLWEPFAKVDR